MIIVDILECVRSDFDSRYPCVTFQSKIIKDITFVLAIGNEEAFQIGNLCQYLIVHSLLGRQLKIYTSLHPFTRQLCIAFRAWAHVRFNKPNHFNQTISDMCNG